MTEFKVESAAKVPAVNITSQQDLIAACEFKIASEIYRRTSRESSIVFILQITHDAKHKRGVIPPKIAAYFAAVGNR